MQQPRPHVTELAKPKTKLDRLVKAYVELGNEFRDLDNPVLEKLAAPFLSVTNWLDEVNAKAKRSALVGGLEQGLREVPTILTSSNLPVDVQRLAFKAYYHVVEKNIDGFFIKDLEKREKIVARGKIKSENEFYLIRNRVDEIEGEASFKIELSVLYKLIDDYEKIA